MRKLMALLLAGIIVLSACTAETPPMSESEYEIETEPLQTTTLPKRTVPPAIDPEVFAALPRNPEPTREELESIKIQELADEIAEAFVNKNTEFLSNIFQDYSGMAFEFLHELEFTEFELIERESNTFYFNITVDDGTDDVFTLGGREWELQLNRDDYFGAIRQFSPRGKIILEEWNVSDYALMCMQFSSNLRLFETMSDFNLLNDNSYWFYIALMVPLGGFGGGIETNDFIERAKYHFDIDITIEELIEIRPRWERSVDSDGHGWYWHYSELVSEEYCENYGTVIINWFADTAYFIVARTMQYNLEFGEQGVKLISTELLYSDEDLILASNGT